MKITGQILDYSDEALIGANVYPVVNNKSIGIGTATDFDGNFQLESEKINDDSIIRISYIGYETVDLPVGKINNKTIYLKEALDSLNEIVITAKKPSKTSNKFTFNTKQKQILAGMLIVLATVGIVYKIRTQ